MRSRCVIFSISKFCKYFSANVRYKMQEVVRRCQEVSGGRQEPSVVSDLSS